MVLNREERVKAWANDKQRHDFLKTHKEWDEWVRVDELHLVFRKFEVTPTKWIVAMEYRMANRVCIDKEGTWRECVKYFIHETDKPFAPNPVQEYEITNLFKREKMRLQEEIRAEKKK